VCKKPIYKKFYFPEGKGFIFAWVLTIWHSNFYACNQNIILQGAKTSKRIHRKFLGNNKKEKIA